MTAERPRLPYDPADIRERLQKRMRSLLDALGIREDIKGGLCTPRNPRRNDRKPGSFVIWCDPARDGCGSWCDYAIGRKGSVFDLVMYLGGLADWIDAYWWALDFLNLQRGVVRSADQARLDDERREADRKAASAKAASDQAARSRALLGDWLALAPIAGTLAEVYLRSARGIDLSRLARSPDALRFAPALDHLDEETGEVTTWPAMVALMTRGSAAAALHRTWLAPDGLGKAPVAKAKKMRGPTKGAAIRLARGPTGLSPPAAAKAGKRGPLAIGEGIETALTVAAARPDYRVWAAGSLNAMRGFDWPDCASAIVLLRDNDWGDQARAEFDRVEAHWRAQAAGRPVVVAASKAGSDFNDMVREAK